MALKAATVATPNMKMQIIRVFEQMRSSLDCLKAMALAPSREEMCAMKGGHIIRNAKKNSGKKQHCHECDKLIISTTELRHDDEVQLSFHKNIQYWTDDCGNPLYGR